jgi:hypothetical protein
VRRPGRKERSGRGVTPAEPDQEHHVAALAGPLLAGSSGAVRVQTVPLIPSERMDEARDRIADAAYRAPGEH